MEEVIGIVTSYGMDTILIALSINIATNLLKVPIKKISAKLEPKGMNVKKYITLLPLILGIIFASLATGLFIDKGNFWNEKTSVLAVSSGSLSLALYAIFEKFMKSSKQDNQLYTAEDLEKAKNIINKFDDAVNKANTLDDSDNNIEKDDSTEILNNENLLVIENLKEIDNNTNQKFNQCNVQENNIAGLSDSINQIILKSGSNNIENQEINSINIIQNNDKSLDFINSQKDKSSLDITNNNNGNSNKYFI